MCPRIDIVVAADVEHEVHGRVAREVLDRVLPIVHFFLGAVPARALAVDPTGATSRRTASILQHAGDVDLGLDSVRWLDEAHTLHPSTMRSVLGGGQRCRPLRRSAPGLTIIEA
jgi:hypothetical protein